MLWIPRQKGQSNYRPLSKSRKLLGHVVPKWINGNGSAWLRFLFLVKSSHQLYGWGCNSTQTFQVKQILKSFNLDMVEASEHPRPMDQKKLLLWIRNFSWGCKFTSWFLATKLQQEYTSYCKLSSKPYCNDRGLGGSKTLKYTNVYNKTYLKMQHTSNEEWRWRLMSVESSNKV